MWWYEGYDCFSFFFNYVFHFWTFLSEFFIFRVANNKNCNKKRIFALTGAKPIRHAVLVWKLTKQNNLSRRVQLIEFRTRWLRCLRTNETSIGVSGKSYHDDILRLDTDVKTSQTIGFVKTAKKIKQNITPTLAYIIKRNNS